jgi:hypothetical protein
MPINWPGLLAFFEFLTWILRTTDATSGNAYEQGAVCKFAVALTSVRSVATTRNLALLISLFSAEPSSMILSSCMLVFALFAALVRVDSQVQLYLLLLS